jgi:hypothetical protein
MKVAHLCWYLCGLLALALLLTSATSFHPNAEGLRAVELGVEAGLAILFGILAVVLTRLNLTEPQWVVRTFQCLAFVATVFVVLMVGG